MTSREQLDRTIEVLGGMAQSAHVGFEAQMAYIWQTLP